MLRNIVDSTMDKQKSAKRLFELLDKYLIEDLKTMIIEIPQRPRGGGLGYPAMQTIISGMELLGMCVSGGDRKDKAIKYFWENYLQKNYPEYAPFQDTFYKNIPHSIAHLYLMRTGISLTKNETNHLQAILGPGGQKILNIDLVILFRHFLVCYDQIKRDLKEQDNFERFWSGFSKLFDEITRHEKSIKSLLDSRFPQAQPSPRNTGIMAASSTSSTISYINFGGGDGVSGTDLPKD